jgi:hypothetical protein
MLPLAGSSNYSKPLDWRSIHARCWLEARLILLILLLYRNSTVRFARWLRVMDVNWLLQRLRKLRFLLAARSMEDKLLSWMSRVVSWGRVRWAENSFSLVHLLTRVVASWNFASLLHSLYMVLLASYPSYFFFCYFSVGVKVEESYTWHHLFFQFIALRKTLLLLRGGPS